MPAWSQAELGKKKRFPSWSLGTRKKAFAEWLEAENSLSPRGGEGKSYIVILRKRSDRIILLF
jgi:hypothetical protein